MCLASKFRIISTPNKKFDLIIIQQVIGAMRHNAQSVITEPYISVISNAISVLMANNN